MDNKEDGRRWQQVVYVLMPLFLLLACLVFINFVPRQLATGVAPTATPMLQSEVAVTAVATPTDATSIPTITPLPTPTIIPTPTLPPEAAIELLGPPDSSRFGRSDTITFYADWPVALAEAQQLAAYVQMNDQSPLLLGTLDEPNIGQRYRWQMNAGQLNVAEMVTTAVSFEWWVELQGQDDTSPILTSSTRQVTILP